MNALNKQVATLLATVCTMLPIAVAHAKSSMGGSDGGGGFQYPNAKLLLKVVSTPLAKSIEAMDDKAFQNFPRTLRRVELAKIIRTVVSMPEEYRERENADGESEGLMFDYDRNYCDSKGCGPRIIALKPFFDAYKGLPVAQLEKQRTKEKMYLLTLDDVRQRLVHEAAHLLNIGITAKTDPDADVFFERLTNAANNQIIVCQAPDWRETKKLDIFEGFLIHLQTGKMGYTWNYAYPQLDRDTGKAYSIRVLNLAATSGSSDGFNPYPEASNAIQHIEAGNFSIVDGVLNWESTGDSEIRDAKITATADLRTGKGTLTRVRDVDLNARKVTSLVTSEMNCRLESPVINMKF